MSEDIQINFPPTPDPSQMKQKLTKGKSIKGPLVVDKRREVNYHKGKGGVIQTKPSPKVSSKDIAPVAVVERKESMTGVHHFAKKSSYIGRVERS